MSYALGRLKADCCSDYRKKKIYWCSRSATESDLLKALTDERHTKLTAPAGAWWQHVQHHIAIRNVRRDGDAEKLAELEEVDKAERRNFEQHLQVLTGIVESRRRGR